MPRVTLISLLAFAVTASAADLTKSWTVSGPLELRIRTTDASLVIKGDSAGGLQAALNTQGWSIGGSDGVQLIDHQNGNTLDLEVRLPRGRFNMGNRTAKLTLHVPRDLMLDARSGDGSIDLSGLHGKLLLETGDGSIHGRELDGSLEAHSGDGSMQFSGRFDRLQLRAQDGSLNIDVRPGSKLTDSWRMEAGDGSVNVKLPSGLSAELDLRTSDGSINVSGTGDHDRHNVHRKLGSGGNLLTIKTGDGSINLAGL